MSLTSSSSASLLVYEFQPLTPAGTAENAPNFVAMVFPNLEVDIIEWMVPAGPQGNLGWQIQADGVTIIPQNGTWVITDDERGSWEVDELPVNGNWGLLGYNTGTYDHTVYIRFLVSPLSTTPTDTGLIVVPNWPAGIT